MPKGKKGSRPPLVEGDRHDPKDLRPMMARFLEWMRVRNQTERTVLGYEASLRAFATWVEERGVRRPCEVTKAVLEQYQRHLFYRRKEDGKGLSYSTQCNYLAAVRSFFRYLTRHGMIETNPAGDLDLPRREQRLPPTILTPTQAEAIVNQPNVKTALGIRDRTMLEVLWSTGMRRAELAALSVYSVSHDRATVMIRQGKGKKDRVVPIAPRALSWVTRYLNEVRPGLAVQEDPGVLFVSATGKGLTPDEVSQIVAGHVRAAGIEAGACHLFRHGAATGMLENGADLRVIQTLLGHESVDTTTVYTHVSIEKLREVHAATHPGTKRRDEDPVPG